MQCPKCGNVSCSKNGINTSTSGEIKHRFRCKNCSLKFQVSSMILSTQTSTSNIFIKDVTETDKYDDVIKNIAKNKKFVITSIQPNATINLVFLDALKLYCKTNNSMLLVIPTAKFSEIPKEVEQYLIGSNINLHPKLKLLGNIKLSSTAANPLSGFASMSMGDSIIIGHPQLQLTTLPVQSNDNPVIMTTTGTLSNKSYTETKAGYKAEFNHSMSAVVVELDSNLFHIRHLNFDGVGFYDFENYYTPSTIVCDGTSVDAIITGDEHVIFADLEVSNATYGKNGIVDSLKPKYIVRHDILDCYAISHHHKNDALTTYKKFSNGLNDIRTELNTTIQYI